MNRLAATLFFSVAAGTLAAQTQSAPEKALRVVRPTGDGAVAVDLSRGLIPTEINLFDKGERPALQVTDGAQNQHVLHCLPEPLG